jgi:hypothetical protein
MKRLIGFLGRWPIHHELLGPASDRAHCAMGEPNWKQAVLQSLEQRDTRELASAEVYDACQSSFLPCRALTCRPETR